MKRSTDRILVTHQGTLPRPDDLQDLLGARSSGQPYDRGALAARIQRAVKDAVRRQVECGIDVVNDGEMSKTSFSDYVSDRLGGLAPTAEPYVSPINGRDLREFPEYFASRRGFGNRQAIGYRRVVFQCVAPLSYIGQQAVQTDIANLKAALATVNVEEAYLPAVAPGSIAHWLQNAYYKDEEAFLYAIADAMHEEYRAIVDAGFLLQIDDPDLADGWQVHPHLTLDEYRQVAELRTAVLNHALHGIPADRVRMHMCWGSYHGPHKHDLPLRDFVDIVLQVQADSYSIEASNPRHAHEWRVWEEVRLPPGKQLIPGVVGHCSDFIEHPELVAERLVTYARLVGRENIMAGTDCGLGTRVGHGAIAFAKFQALAEGARMASKRLWS
jgi:5-methyltetrahydropteroyltriglutamate--homocysteine methyltransferase